MNSKENTIFLLGKDEDGAVLSVGMTDAAWDYCKDGKTHTFDLTKLGIPLKLMIFGGRDKPAIMADIKEQAKAWGLEVKDETAGDNFGIKGKAPH